MCFPRGYEVLNIPTTEKASLELEAPPPDLRDLTLFGPEWLSWLRGRTAAPAIPAPGSMLELLPSSALSPAQVIRVYGREGNGIFRGSCSLKSRVV
jgi:hypothetical protein